MLTVAGGDLVRVTCSNIFCGRGVVVESNCHLLQLIF